MSDDAEGSQPPSAPESPDRETPSTPPESEGEGRAESGRPRLLPVWILLGAAAISGGAWGITEHLGGSGPPPDEAQVPFIAASAEPYKVRPDDPGGMEIPNQGTLIYETLNTADPEEAPERIMPPPEEPLSPPQPEEAGAEQPVMPAPDAEGESAALSPGGAPEPGLTETALVEEAPLPAFEAPDPTLAEPLVEPVAEPEPDAPSYVSTLVGVPLPPIRPGASTPTPIEVVPLAEVEALEPALAENARPPEPDTPVLALAEESPPPEPDTPATSLQPEDAAPVPVAVFKPVNTARPTQAEPSGEATGAAVTATPEPAAETVPEPAQSTPGNWRYVQLGASNARNKLEAHWEMLRRDHDDVLIGLSPLIMPVDSGDNGITYRLRAGPLGDEDGARWVCAQLKARGLDCFVPRD